MNFEKHFDISAISNFMDLKAKTQTLEILMFYFGITNTQMFMINQCDIEYRYKFIHMWNNYIRMYDGLRVNTKDNKKKKKKKKKKREKVSSLSSINVLKYWLQVIVTYRYIKNRVRIKVQ